MGDTHSVLSMHEFAKQPGAYLIFETSFGIIKQASPSLCLILLLSKPRRLKIGQLRTCLIKQGAGETAGYVISVPFYYTAYKKHSEH